MSVAQPKIKSPFKGTAFFKHLGRSWSQIFNQVRTLKVFQRKPGKLLLTVISHVLICCKMCVIEKGKQRPPLGYIVRDEGENFNLAFGVC